MNNGFTQRPPVRSGQTRFEHAPNPVAERSRMSETSRTFTAFNAGDLVPLKCIEVLPSQSLFVAVDEVVRQTTIKFPTMGEMILDIFAFFVPNRVVNESWKEQQGENSSGSWTAPDVSLAPLTSSTGSAISVPVGSVADYYGLPTQGAIPRAILSQMHDLPFRGYLAIYNEYFRDQNYQPPIPFSRLNVYEGFLEVVGSDLGFAPDFIPYDAESDNNASGAYPYGAVIKSMMGSGGSLDSDTQFITNITAGTFAKTSWSALDKPLKVNKLHDAFTSVLPSPQKGPDVALSAFTSTLPITGDMSFTSLAGNKFQVNLSQAGQDGNQDGTVWSIESPNLVQAKLYSVGGTPVDQGSGSIQFGAGKASGTSGLSVDLSEVSAITVDDLRLAIATQQLYELYARSGSRYRELCHAMFGVTADDPYSDIPQFLGKHRVTLELYQTAQTSATEAESPQGTLAAFGYTSKGGQLFHSTFLEHGYVHILACVRQRNVYPSYLAPHWFRLNKLDYYTPVMANISEQPIMLQTLNPFAEAANTTVFGYQEAWWEYRQHPDEVTGVLRSGVEGSLSAWTYQDIYSSSMSSADDDFMQSNAQQVLDPTLAVESSVAPQFIGQFAFSITNDFPGPVYSVPGLDEI